MLQTSAGTAPIGSGTTPTARRHTGQIEESGLGGLYFYNARWYEAGVGRFLQADTVVPGAGNPQALNRYSYSLSNPIRYTDPSGHWVESAVDAAFILYDLWDISQNGLSWESGLSLAADVGGLLLPVVTGGGAAVRAAFHADDAAKAVAHADDALKVFNAADNLGDAGKYIDTIPPGSKCYCDGDLPVGPNGLKVDGSLDVYGDVMPASPGGGVQVTSASSSRLRANNIEGQGRLDLDVEGDINIGGDLVLGNSTTIYQGVVPATQPLSAIPRTAQGVNVANDVVVGYNTVIHIPVPK